jgi:hypothetical protein
MAADTTPLDLTPDAGHPPLAPSADDGHPRSIRSVLIASLLALAALWGLGSTALGGEIQHAVEHAFPGLDGGCGEPGG